MKNAVAIREDLIYNMCQNAKRLFQSHSIEALAAQAIPQWPSPKPPIQGGFFYVRCFSHQCPNRKSAFGIMQMLCHYHQKNGMCLHYSESLMLHVFFIIVAIHPLMIYNVHND